MRVGLNATCFNDRPSGAKQRFVGIYSQLVKQLPNCEFVVFEPEDCHVAAWFDGAPNVTARRTPIPSLGRTRKFLSGLRYWKTGFQDENFDIFERFNLPIVKAPSGRTMVTIHDIRGVHLDTPFFRRAAYKGYIGKSLESADHVITVSEAMKKEILSYFPRNEVTVIYNGLDTGPYALISDSDCLAVRRKFSLPSEFVLAVGHIEARKNYPRLIDAVARLRDRGRSCYIVIIGNDSGERRAIQQRIEAESLSGYVKILSGLSDLEVRCAYKMCSLFIFPSAYEGFGIPILEAMAASRPMVLSDLPVFREITQNSGVYFPHDNVESMACAIEMVLGSKAEQDRIVIYGRTRVQAFGFHSLAARLGELYFSMK